jgi:hypothetical protein
MRWNRKTWTRAQLEKILGPPDWEANDESRVEYHGDAVHVYSTAAQKHAAPPPPIVGVDRWMSWDCSKIEPFDAQTQDTFEHLQRGTANLELSQEEADALRARVKDHLKRAADHCYASTRVKDGESSDVWFMSRVCSKHSELED